MSMRARQDEIFRQVDHVDPGRIEAERLGGRIAGDEPVDPIATDDDRLLGQRWLSRNGEDRAGVQDRPARLGAAWRLRPRGRGHERSSAITSTGNRIDIAVFLLYSGAGKKSRTSHSYG